MAQQEKVRAPHYCFDCGEKLGAVRCKCRDHDDGTLTCASCGKRGYLKRVLESEVSR